MSKVLYKDGIRCRMQDKIMYSEKRAKSFAEKWKPDDRGKWSAYKCPYGKGHWHIGHEAKS